MVKTSFQVKAGETSAPMETEIKRAPYLGQEARTEPFVQQAVVQARAMLGANADRPADDVIRELKSSPGGIPKPVEVLMVKGYSPKGGESMSRFLERGIREESLQTRIPKSVPTTPVNEVAQPRQGKSLGGLREKSLPMSEVVSKMKDKSVEEVVALGQETPGRNTLKLVERIEGIRKMDFATVPGEGVEKYIARFDSYNNRFGSFGTRASEAIHSGATWDKARLMTPEDLRANKDLPENFSGLKQALNYAMKTKGFKVIHGESTQDYLNRYEQSFKNPQSTPPSSLPTPAREPETTVLPEEVAQKTAEHVPSMQRAPQQAEAIEIPRGEVSPETKMIADKWGLIAKEGIGGNSNWGVVRGERAMDIYNAKLPRGEAGSPEIARLQMQSLLRKAQAMGFRPGVDEPAGTYFDRMAKELSVPPTDKQLVERGHTMWNLMNKQISVRGNLDFNSPSYSAERLLNQKVLPGMESTPAGKEFTQAQGLMQKILQGTGVRPAPGETADAYAERALRVQLKKTPTLHVDTILNPRPVAVPVPPTPVPRMTPQSIPAPTTPSVSRWDREA